MTTITGYVNDLAKELDVVLSPDNFGNYTIPLDEGLNVQIASVPQGIALFSAFLANPTQNRDALYSHYLSANLFGQGTRGAVIGLSQDGKMLTLSKLLDYAVSYKEFRDSLEDFINTIDFLRDEAKNFLKK